MRIICSARLLIFALVFGPVGLTEAANEGSGLIRGVLDHGHAYFCGTWAGRVKGVTTAGQGIFVVLRGSLEGETKATAHQLPNVYKWNRYVWDGYDVYLRWQIADGQFWMPQFWPHSSNVGRRMGDLRRLPVAGVAAFLSPTDQWPSGKEEVERIQRAIPQVQGVCQLEPLDAALVEASLHDTGPVHFDFLAGPGNRCSLFILSAKRMSRWDYRYTAGQDTRANSGEWTWEESWEADWSGPFYAHAAGPSYYFITESGQVYAAKLSSQGGNGKTKLIWNGRPRLITLVADASDGKAFAFGKDFFFEVKEEVDVRRCEEITVGGTGAEDALRSVIHCGRILHRPRLKR